ncbi:hypothetical protein TURU_160908 [Turdus rufiventris]|nr:hypothetical protein TURU_160908 [Turdus rufiventris]
MATGKRREAVKNSGEKRRNITAKSCRKTAKNHHEKVAKNRGEKPLKNGKKLLRKAVKKRRKIVAKIGEKLPQKRGEKAAKTLQIENLPVIHYFVAPCAAPRCKKNSAPYSPVRLVVVKLLY